MATALTMDVPPPHTAPPHLPMNMDMVIDMDMDAHASTMAAASESFAKPSSPRPIPSPVSIPPRFDDDNHMSGAFHASGSSPSPQASPRFQHVPPPPPIPDFVFPARSSTSAPSSYSRATGRRPKSVADLHDRGTLSPGPAGHTPVRTMRSPALPDFSFNPGASLPPTPGHAFLSPPQSPQSPRAIPARPGGGGHRRGGSEFVGGSVRHGEAFTFMSTSPTKSESGLSSPLLSPLNSPSGPSGAPGSKPAGPPHGRRGHAHRRSAAISSHDISDILQPTSPNPPPGGNSAPNSPSGFDYKEAKAYIFPERTPTDSAKALSITDVEDPETSTNPEEVPEPEAATPADEPVADQQRFSTTPKSAAQPRARVGFSDTLEFIPRPLSLVSSDTSSTMTARPPTGSGNHSVSGSISSIISLNASIAASIERDGISPLVRSPSRSTVTESRPSTAGAVLDRTQSIIGPDDNEGVSPRRRNSIPLLAAMSAEAPGTEAAAQALPSPNKTPKRWSFFSLDPFIGGSSSNSISSPKGSCHHSPVFADEPSPKVPDSVTSVASHTASQKMDRSVAPTEDTVMDDAPSPSKAVTRKLSNNKKKKKVKTWGILGRKSKPRRKSRRAPTPPPVQSQVDSDDEESIEVPAEAIGLAISEQQAADNFVPPPVVLVTPSGSPSEPRDAFSTWQPLPSPSISAPDDDTSFPMIDLDAALGPFNTPLPRNFEWEAAQRAGGLSKRQLHSAAGMTRFTGPGMHYSHRRAESAPEMPPFNRAGIPRFNSSSAMADVFEEEEEEDENKAASGDKTESPTSAKQPQQIAPKPTSVHSMSSTSSSSTPPRQPSEFLDHRPPSINIRVTSSDGAEGSSYDRGFDFPSAISDDATSSIALSRRGSGLSGLSDDDKTQPSMGLKSEYSASSLHDDVIVEEDAGSFTFGDDGCDFVMESSSDSTIHSPGRLMKGKDLAPVDVSPLHLPATGSLAPISPYSMAPSSAFPSPRSPMSYDANRISTAPSSVTEDNFQSLLLGEPGPEVRISSDIPSLTSSNSTMTRESAIPHNGPQYPPLGGQPRPYLPSRGNDRPASFTSTAFGRRRSSLASLHRLISTSHGERSKLSIEVQLDSASTTSATDPEKKGKHSKAKRISRMMQFWRGKDEATS